MQAGQGVLGPAAVLALLLQGAPSEGAVEQETFLVALDTGWTIQPAADVREKGDVVSSPAFRPRGWSAGRVPTTVLAALVGNGQHRDLYHGKNLDSVSQEPFQKPWWFRKEFTLPEPVPASVRLVFEGVNYRANVWVNGQRMASDREIVGAFRRFDIEVGRVVRPGTNAVAVEVVPPRPGDYTIGFVDWNPKPPDANMGLWRPVQLRTTGPVSLEDVFVESRLASSGAARAALTVHATLVNRTRRPSSALVQGEIESIRIARRWDLAPGERRSVSFSPEQFPALDLENPRLWWPLHYGEPNLYALRLAAVVGGHVSDRQEVTFGIREVRDYINEDGHRGYMINGKKILIRGGGWVDDLLLREDARNLEAQFQYIRHMNLNAIRLEGFWGSSRTLYDLADRHGILVLVGWSCQWEWKEYLGKEVDEYGPAPTEPEMALLDSSLRDQVLWLRNHPSVVVWVLGSDTIPRPALEARYRRTLREVDPSRPYLAGCKSKTSTLSGPTAVKMEGPYDYVTPNYWYLDTQHGGAFGFNTETGPGPQPPPLDSLRRMIPADHLWPIDDVWSYHCGRNEFGALDRYLLPLARRYGMPGNVEEFALVAQAANYEAIRPMFEAFSVHKPRSTGVIQWMLNAAWPKLYWQLYDHYLMPGGAFFGARTACQPTSLVYNYADHAVYAVNDRPVDLAGLRAQVRVLDADSREVLRKEVPVDLPQLSSQKVVDLRGVAKESPVRFVALTLVEREDRIVARNFYWLSSRDDVLDWERTQWFHTPNKDFADLTALLRLPRAEVERHLVVEAQGEARRARVTLRNRSDRIAFFLELAIVGQGSRKAVRPVLWDDNYVSLLPGEERTLVASFSAEDLEGEEPALALTGFNVKD